MRNDDLYALQISLADYQAYQLRRHSVESLIVADKLYDRSFVRWWIGHWLEEPTTPLDQLPPCVEHEILQQSDIYVNHVKYCVNNDLLDVLRVTWVSEAVPKDIMDAVRLQDINMETVRYLLEEGFPPTEKMFLYAVIESHTELLKICFGHGWNINQKLGEYTPLEWCAAYSNVDAVNTCLLYGANITDRALTNAITHKDNFLRLCQEEEVDLKGVHLYALVNMALHAYNLTRTVPTELSHLFEEMYARNVRPGVYEGKIRKIRDFVMDPILKTILSLFC